MNTQDWVFVMLGFQAGVLFMQLLKLFFTLLELRQVNQAIREIES